ncbi:hypothetical protein AB4876_10975 [Zhongshania guokunii]|uniref:Peptidase M50B-like protein n=1 Tax=Zhongshania guokunii TaxID=641783 RepID=A0ABV3U692_9GAMM
MPPLRKTPSSISRHSADGFPANVSPAGVLAIAATFVILLAYYGGGYNRFIPILDHANLAFHEAGHVLFGFFGQTAGLYGGTFGQLVFPLIVFMSFYRRGQIMQAGLGLLWLFQNFLNIARYVADARAQQLPLVGGGDHDWFNILYRWDALPADKSFAATLTTVAWLGMILSFVWVLRLWIKSQK